MYHSTPITSLDFMDEHPEDAEKPFKVVMSDWFDEKHLKDIHAALMTELITKHGAPASLKMLVDGIPPNAVLPRWTTTKRDHADWQSSDMGNDDQSCYEVSRGWTGRLPVRLERFYRSETRLGRPFDMLWTVPENFAEIIGNIARKHIPKEREVWCRWNFDLNWEAGAYRDRDSCFWQSRAPAREVFRRNGVIALLATKSDRPGSDGVGRCWVYPHKSGPIAFNAYGLPLLTWANLIAARYGRKHHSIKLTNENVRDDLVYINNHGRAFHLLIPDQSPPFDDYELGFKYGAYSTCGRCHVGYFNEDMILSPILNLCKPCAAKTKYRKCDGCGETFPELTLVNTDADEWLCHPCTRRSPKCDMCGNSMSYAYARSHPKGICHSCETNAKTCSESGCSHKAYRKVIVSVWNDIPVSDGWTRTRRSSKAVWVCEDHRTKFYQEVYCRTNYEYYRGDNRLPCPGCGKEYDHD